MAKWIKFGSEEGTTRSYTCSCCNISQTVNVYQDKPQFKFCPYCGARMEDVSTDGPMSADEFHKMRIIPLRNELSRHEREYERRWAADKAKEAGVDKISCDNCARSCVLMIDDHNGCLGGKCTCCNSWCYRWMPENEVSKYLREHHKYDEGLIYKLEDFFGDDFLKCNNIELLLEAMKLMNKMEEEKRSKK